MDYPVRLRSFRTRLLLVLLLISYFVFTYNVLGGWWYSSVGTLLILFFSYLIWGKSYTYVTGFKFNLITILKALLLAIVIVCFSVLIVKHIGDKNGIAIIYTGFGNYYHDVFYTLNEEIILGGIAIHILLDRWRLSPLPASAFLALAFSLVHFVFYKWVFLDKGIIEPDTLLVLFLVGFLRNNLIILFRHIAYSWALHFGWMAVMFGSYLYRPDTGAGLTEYERFNIFLGSTEMLVAGGIMAIVSTYFLLSKNKKPGHDETI